MKRRGFFGGLAALAAGLVVGKNVEAIAPVAKTTVDLTTPTGCIFPFAGSCAPEGFIECHGEELLIEDYANLFKVIGNWYGGDKNRGTFRTPDLRSWFVPASHTFSVGEIPTHTHSIYSTGIPTGTMSGVSTGHSHGHSHVQPTMIIDYIIKA
jgi:microcystin-dependent protein